ncbi:nibrin [Drosophila grimshawi]|uniref:GH16022 n=1 Tax=Drosophila grimshawi TaxID=7222 RepID=B4J2P8_DROGR|nr:nibrin [Drosophila grimshawi]EDV96039.1 GH16022 [Drosophila grimshawi]
MFVLNKVDNESVKFILLPVKATYTVGRLSTDLILSEDLSISRTHVSLCLSSNELTVEDLGSRYGTFINSGIEKNKKMPAKTPTPLQIGDKVRFGALKNIWQVSQLKLTTTGSALEGMGLRELDQLMRPLGGVTLQSWTDECSHLTMDTVSITAKLLHALLENKPIVRVDFWREMLKFARRINVTEDWPQSEDFAPAQPSDMPSIRWRSERTKLFVGITFVFMNRKHLEMYGSVVQKAGGLCKDLNLGVSKRFLTKKNVVVIQYVSSTQSQATETISSVQAILEQAGLRLIPDYEIGLAILNCSLDKFCNPSHVAIEHSVTTTESMNSSILVPNTERTQTEHCNKNSATEFVVPESHKSQIYGLSVGSEKHEKSESAPKEMSCTTRRRSKRNNPIYVDDSSDDDDTKDEQPTKKVKKAPESIVVESSDEEPIARRSKRRVANVVDSDEDLPLEKKTKQNANVDIGLSLEDEAALESIANSVETPIDENLVKNKSKVERQKKTPVISARRSTRGNPQPPQEDEPAVISPRRSMRGKPTAANVMRNDKDDSSQDEELFQFEAHTSAAVVPDRAVFKPTEADIASNDKSADKSVSKPTKISVRNFLEKSQKHVATQKVVETPATTQPRKRLCLEVLKDNDGVDLDNLFQFGNSKKPKTAFGADNNDEDLFNFKERAQQEQSKLEHSDADQDSVCTEPFRPETKTKSRYIVPKPKELPRKIDTSGWLSCSGLHVDVKPEPKSEPDTMNAETAQPTNIKVELDDDAYDEKLNHDKWLAGIRNGIQVRMYNLNISVRSQDETDAANITASKYIGRKNFKKFIKTNNAHPQQQILGLKRMQLADGIVVNL